MPRMSLSTLLCALATMAAPLAISNAHADIINWNLLYGGETDIGGQYGRPLAPPVYTVVPMPIDGAGEASDHVSRANTRHRVYRHEAHWQIRGDRPHQHPHEHGEYVHREIYRQPREDRERGEE